VVFALAAAVALNPVLGAQVQPPRGPARPLLAGTRASAFTTIQGNALSATNSALPDAVVRLRDARYGGVVSVQRTDRAGLFSFTKIDPGIYVVELVSGSELILAASPLLVVNAGDTLSTIVKLSALTPVAIGLAGHVVPAAIAVTAAAAASGVMAVKATGQDITGRQ